MMSCCFRGSRLRACVSAVALLVGVAVISGRSTVRAQSPAEEFEWLPWASTVDTGFAADVESLTAADGLQQIQSTSLFAENGEQLVFRLVMSEQFAAVQGMHTRLAAGADDDAMIQARQGMLLTCSAYMAESEAEILRIATEADQAFDAAIKIDEELWEAWFGKAILYAYSTDAQLEQAALLILEPLVEAQAQDQPQAKYASACVVLGDLYSRLQHQEEAQQTWQYGADRYPEHVGLKKRVQKAK